MGGMGFKTGTKVQRGQEEGTIIAIKSQDVELLVDGKMLVSSESFLSGEWKVKPWTGQWLQNATTRRKTTNRMQLAGGRAAAEPRVHHGSAGNHSQDVLEF